MNTTARAGRILRGSISTGPRPAVHAPSATQFLRAITTASSSTRLSRPACGRAALVQQAKLYRRGYASFDGKEIEPIEVSFDVVQPPTPSSELEGQCLVVCHGLFGSKQNWRSLAKAFAQKLGIPVYTLDLRNHGSSPHAEPHSYEAMAVDIAHFLKQQGLTSGVNLVGHSMGGKSVMAFALNEELNGPLRSLVSVDMSPAKGRISPEFASYAEAMIETEDARVKSKSEADKVLQKVEPILSTRQFLLTNTKTVSDPEPRVTFRIPLQLLHRAIPNIGDFPYSPPPPVEAKSPQWDGPTLFMKGEHSKYLNRHNIPIAKAFFPNMRLETLDAGHWVHAEQPAETVRLIDEFVRGVKA